MLDISGASRSVQSTASNTYLASMNINATMAATKASWNVAIEGAYALIEPLVHKDYYTIDEIDMFNDLLDVAIATGITIPYNSHQHPASLFWAYSTLSSMMFNMPVIATIPQETFITKISRPIEVSVTSVTSGLVDAADLELGALSTELIEVYAYSSVIGMI